MTDKELIDALRAVESRSKAELLEEAAKRLETLSDTMDLVLEHRSQLINEVDALKELLALAEEDLKSSIDSCEYCIYLVDGLAADSECNCECEECQEPCTCKNCKDSSCWDWRGLARRN